jgi:hypothetical protein
VSVAQDLGYSRRMAELKRKLRLDRLIGAIVVLGGIGFAVYWFAIR